MDWQAVPAAPQVHALLITGTLDQGNSLKIKHMPNRICKVPKESNG